MGAEYVWVRKRIEKPRPIGPTPDEILRRFRRTSPGVYQIFLVEELQRIIAYEHSCTGKEDDSLRSLSPKGYFRSENHAKRFIETRMETQRTRNPNLIQEEFILKGEYDDKHWEEISYRIGVGYRTRKEMLERLHCARLPQHLPGEKGIEYLV